jgi:TolA-binding protein
MATEETTETLKEKLAKQIDQARGKLETLRNEIQAMHEEDIETLQQRREELNQRLAEQKTKAQQLKTDIANWNREKVAHTKDAIASWQQRREINKLQTRADRAREYALDMVSVVALDFEEAEQAVFDAVTARLEAESAASAAT